MSDSIAVSKETLRELQELMEKWGDYDIETVLMRCVERTWIREFKLIGSREEKTLSPLEESE